MEEVTNLKGEELLDVIKDFPFTPSRHKVLITVNTVESEDDILLSSNDFDEVQYIVASAQYSEYQPGDKVLLDTDKMSVTMQSPTNADERITQIKIRPVEVNGRVYALISESIIEGKYV